MNEAIPYGPSGVFNVTDQEKPGTYQPTDEETEAIELVEKLFQKAKKARKPYDEKWLDYYRMFRGKQWKESRPSYRHSEVINLIFRAIQAEIPILTDTRPKPDFIPQEPGDLPLAKILNDVLDSDWENGNWLMLFTEVLYDAHFYGAGFGSLTYDPKANMGIGGIKLRSEDPFHIYPDPYCRDVNYEANYFIHAEPVAVDRLKRDYPDMAKYIKPDLIDIPRRSRATVKEQMLYKSPVDSRTMTENSSQYDLGLTDEALKIDLYIHDEEFIEEEIAGTPQNDAEEAQEAAETLFVQKLKYPRGRHISIVNGVLLSDDPIEFDDCKFPYFRLLNYVLPHEFWGISDIEQMESPQKTFNKLISFTLDVLTLMGNPVWIVSTDSNVDVENMFNRPGLIIEKSPNSEVRREEGVQLQPYVLQMIDRMKSWFDDISGSSDVSRGIRPEGVQAAAAIEALQDASQTRLRQKSRNIDACLVDFAKMYASRVFQFYSAPRIFRITNDQNVSNYFKFHVVTVDSVDQVTGQPIQSRVAKVQNFQMGPDGQQYLGEEREYQIKGEFDVRVSSGSSLPFEKSRIETQSYALFDRGIIDAEEVLKNIGYQNAEAVLKRMAEKQAMAAQAKGQAPPPNA